MNPHFNWDLRIPYGYRSATITLRQAEALLLEHHHPVYVRRFLAWLHFWNGRIGIGSTWRAGGAQPDKPGFAPEGKSFHQDQSYADGFTGATAVDVVIADGPDADDNHDTIPWSMSLVQGSAEAAKWGLHANVGVPGRRGSESWHIQPIEIDGWESWWDGGRPAPDPDYPIPAEHDPYPPEEEEPMGPIAVIRLASQPGAFAVWPGGYKTWLPDRFTRDTFLHDHKLEMTVVHSVPKFKSAGPILGAGPAGYDGFGVKLPEPADD